MSLAPQAGPAVGSRDLAAAAVPVFHSSRCVPTPLSQPHAPLRRRAIRQWSITALHGTARHVACRVCGRRTRTGRSLASARPRRLMVSALRRRRRRARGASNNRRGVRGRRPTGTLSEKCRKMSRASGPSSTRSSLAMRARRTPPRCGACGLGCCAPLACVAVLLDLHLNCGCFHRGVRAAAAVCTYCSYSEAVGRRRNLLRGDEAPRLAFELLRRRADAARYACAGCRVQWCGAALCLRWVVTFCTSRSICMTGVPARSHVQRLGRVRRCWNHARCVPVMCARAQMRV